MFCPADEEELVRAAARSWPARAPAYIRYNAARPRRWRTRRSRSARPRSLAEGRDVILTYGILVDEAGRAADILRERGLLGAALVNVRRQSARRGGAARGRPSDRGCIVTVEDHFPPGRLYSIVAELLVREGARAPVLPIALEQRWFRPGLLADVLAYEGFTGAQIAARIRRRAANEQATSPADRFMNYRDAPIGILPASLTPMSSTGARSR